MFNAQFWTVCIGELSQEFITKMCLDASKVNRTGRRIQSWSYLQNLPLFQYVLLLPIAKQNTMGKTTSAIVHKTMSRTTRTMITFQPIYYNCIKFHYRKMNNMIQFFSSKDIIIVQAFGSLLCVFYHVQLAYVLHL